MARRRVRRVRRRRIRRRGGLAKSTASTIVKRTSAPRSSGSLWERIKAKLREGQYISRGLTGLSSFLPQYSGVLSGASGVASALGYGRRRRRTVRRRGRGVRRVGRPSRAALASRRYRRRRRGGSAFTDFFTKTIPGAARSVGNFVYDKVKKPSTWLGAASLIPSPLRIPLRVASGISGALGHGRKRRRVHRRRRGGRKMRVMRGGDYISGSYPM